MRQGPPCWCTVQDASLASKVAEIAEALLQKGVPLEAHTLKVGGCKRQAAGSPYVLPACMPRLPTNPGSFPQPGEGMCALIVPLPPRPSSCPCTTPAGAIWQPGQGRRAARGAAGAGRLAAAAGGGSGGGCQHAGAPAGPPLADMCLAFSQPLLHQAALADACTARRCSWPTQLCLCRICGLLRCGALRAGVPMLRLILALCRRS